MRPFLRTDAYVGTDATSISSDTFFLVGNANVCPLPPDQTFSNIGFSTLDFNISSVRNAIRTSLVVVVLFKVVVTTRAARTRNDATKASWVMLEEVFIFAVALLLLP